MLCEAITDMRGYISELLAKAVDSNALNAPLTAQDKEKLVEFLKTYGDLDPDLFYKGSSRRGYTVPPSAGDQEGKVADPYDLSALIQLGFAKYEVAEWEWDDQMPMFQPVGGVDQIAKAFERQLGNRITFNAEVKEIRKTPEGVRIVYADQSGNTQEATGDYCICTIPLTVLRNIPSDFSPDMQQAIAGVDYYQAGKTGLQFNRRFWEEDEDIYSGITYTNLTINQIWYPSYGYLSNKGVLVSGYHYAYEGFYSEEDAIAIGNLPSRQRISLVLEQGSLIHPQYNNHFENGVSVFWSKIPYNLGAWSKYTSQTRQQYYPRLNEPDGNIYLAKGAFKLLDRMDGWCFGIGAISHFKNSCTQLATKNFASRFLLFQKLLQHNRLRGISRDTGKGKRVKVKGEREKVKGEREKGNSPLPLKPTPRVRSSGENTHASWLLCP